MYEPLNLLKLSKQHYYTHKCYIYKINYKIAIELFKPVLFPPNPKFFRLKPGLFAGISHVSLVCVDNGASVCKTAL